MNLTVPQRAFFSFAFPCQRRRDPPVIDGNLKDWDDSFHIPDLMGIEGQSSFARLSMGWDDNGLYFAVEVSGKTSYKIDPKNYWHGDCLELWIDTRDMKDIHRATRFCHHFFFLPGGSGRDGKSPIGRQTSIDNAREQAPPCSEDSIQVGLKRLKRSYRMEIALPATGLNGYEPQEFEHIGFNYALRDSECGVQSWSVSRDTPVVHDPSTWGSVQLARG